MKYEEKEGKERRRKREKNRDEESFEQMNFLPSRKATWCSLPYLRRFAASESFREVSPCCPCNVKIECENIDAGTSFLSNLFARTSARARSLLTYLFGDSAKR